MSPVLMVLSSFRTSFQKKYI